MKEYTNNDPSFSENIMVLEPTDSAHAENINKGTIQIFQNTLHNYKEIENLNKRMGDADLYNSEVPYKEGDYCLYDGKLYKCSEATDGEWNEDCWVQTDSLKELKELETPDFDDSGEAEGIESFTDFMASFITGTPIYKFLANLKAGLQYVLHAGQLVNNCVTDNPELPLSAAQGKFLMEQITGLNSEIAGGVSVRYNAESDYVQVYNGEKWFDWQSVGLIAFNVLTLPTTAWNRDFTNNNYEFTIAGGELRIKNNTYVTGSVSLTLPQGAFGHNTVEVAGTTYLYTTARASIQVGGIRYQTPAGGSKYNPFVAEFSVSTIVKGDVLTISLPAYAGDGAYYKTEITLTKLLIK